MMRARLTILSLGVTAFATAAIVACGAPTSIELTPEQTKQAAQASTVGIELQDASGAKIGSCSGTLVSKDVVLTAGHCVVAAKKFRVESKVANKSATATVAVTTWKNFGSAWSHPHHADIALIRLEKPIELDAYPKIASAKVASESAALRSLRSGASEEVKLSDGKAKGFRYTYTAGKSEGTLETGGAVVDAKSGAIVGVVSGRGRTSGLLYVTRADLFASWVSRSVACAGGMQTKTYSGDPWGGGSSSGGSSSGGWGGSSSGGWGGSSSGGWGGGSPYGGEGGKIDAGALPPMPEEEGGGSTNGPGSGPGSSGTNGGDTTGGANTCPPSPECVGTECGGAGSSTSNPAGDKDGDGIPDKDDPLPTIPGKPGDMDGDGIPDAQDPLPEIPGKAGDKDGDGIPDGQDPLPEIPGKPGDMDGDGIPDASDPEPTVPSGGGAGSTPGGNDVCPGDEVCPPEPDSATCSGPNCGGCSGEAGCVDELIDYGDCACTGSAGTGSPVLR